MTNKQKISALKKTRKVFDKIAKSNMETNQIRHFLKSRFGVCNYTYFAVLKNRTFDEPGFRNSTAGLTSYFRKEFKVPMPRNADSYKWNLTPEGYASRVKAIDKAIERLSK